MFYHLIRFIFLIYIIMVNIYIYYNLHLYSLFNNLSKERYAKMEDLNIDEIKAAYIKLFDQKYIT
ncbi:hypothetical protein C7959_11433 [Orenia marismortui]|uniref:Uncharacterized protein n=1 Tax=Orenia marismortui TaxID=46469 RepID=A0A4R8GY21_9FIRM|nr:hypothetical protein C7959_11433 [Orenia marismortui]